MPLVRNGSPVRRAGLFAAVVALIAIVLSPSPDGLPAAGQVMPGLLAFAVIAYNTDTFEARDFIRTGAVITLVAAALLVIFSLTNWPWMGYVTRPVR